MLFNWEKSFKTPSLILIGGRPCMGKTQVALKLAKKISALDKVSFIEAEECSSRQDFEKQLYDKSDAEVLIVDTIQNLTNKMAEDDDSFALEQLEKFVNQNEYSGISKQIRRTDAEISSDMSGLDKSPDDYQYEFSVPLKSAVNMANSEPGVYVLYLDGRVMKCGRAAYSQGVAWRLRQYYNLSYDNQSRSGDCWSVNEKNRDRVTVSWQCCPASKCDELESKLFKKYGKGEWAKRMPVYDGGDSWVLII